MGCCLMVKAIFVWPFVVEEREKFENSARNRLKKYSGADNSGCRFVVCARTYYVYALQMSRRIRNGRKKYENTFIWKQKKYTYEACSKNALSPAKRKTNYSCTLRGLLNWSDVFQLYVLFIVKFLLQNVEL